MYLIALAAEGLAVWDGADRAKHVPGPVCAGGIQL